MKTTATARLPRPLLFLLLAYGAASLLHFAHNAEFLADYPNMPAWLTRAQVYGVWLAITALGLAGCHLMRIGYRIDACPFGRRSTRLLWAGRSAFATSC